MADFENIMRILIPVFNIRDPAYSTSEDLRDILMSLGHKAGYMLIHPGSARSDVMAAIKGMKYDLVLCVNHTRRMLWDVFPKEIPFITLLMDTVWGMREKSVVAAFNDRPCDKIFGYVEHLKPFGYDPGKLVETDIPVSPVKFHPPDNMAPHDHGLFFASGKGWPIEMMVKAMEPACLNNHTCFLTKHDLLGMANTLRSLYDNECQTMCADDFSVWVQSQEPSLKSTAERMGGDWPLWCLMFLYWRMHEHVYRQSVVRNLIRRGLALRVAGDGWTDNPEFYDIAMPAIKHGRELASWYFNAGSSLHANGGGCVNHHRITEIMLSGGRPIVLDKYWRLSLGVRLGDESISELSNKQRSIVARVIPVC